MGVGGFGSEPVSPEVQSRYYVGLHHLRPGQWLSGPHSRKLMQMAADGRPEFLITRASPQDCLEAQRPTSPTANDERKGKGEKSDVIVSFIT